MAFLKNLIHWTKKEPVEVASTKVPELNFLAGIQKLNTLFLTHTEPDKLLEQFLTQLLQVLSLQLGAVYLINNQLQELQLVAATGIEQQQLQTSYQLGEGLVGRVASEQKPTTLNRPADTEFEIKTILGVILPATLLHQPIIYQHKLVGVLVVAGSYPINAQTEASLKILAGSLAMYLQNNLCQHQRQAQTAEFEQISSTLNQQHQTIQNLEVAVAQANQLRTHFLSLISHELRTPLTSIIGFSQLSLRDIDNEQPKQRHKSNLERIMRNGQYLLSMINNILDLARMDSDKMELNIDKIDLAEFLKAIVTECRLLALAKKIQLNCKLPNELLYIETDQTKLHQIIFNLVANAIKFSHEEGQVELSLKRFYRQGEKIAITVSDNGIGIESNKQKQIFDQFYQMDDSLTRKYSGAGLGLSVVSHLTRLLQGQIEIQSESGKGSIFTVILPAYYKQPTVEIIEKAHPAMPIAQAAQLEQSGISTIYTNEETKTLINL